MEEAPKHRAACDSCKRMKIKCEWNQDEICNRCSARRTTCIVTTKDRKRREKKEGTYLERLEGRLQRMEQVMTKSILNVDNDKVRHASEDIDTQGGINDKFSLLKIHSNGTTKFVGSASGFSIFSPQGLNWISEVTGSRDFENTIHNMHIPEESLLGGISDPSMWYSMSDDEREPLPPRAIAEMLVKSYFEGWNRIFPLYDKAEFEARFQAKYPVTYSDDIAWYASLNIVLATGWILYPLNNEGDSPQPDSPSSKHAQAQDQRWWKWFRNAASTYVDLQFKEGGLLAVQALIGMSFLLQTLPNPYPCSVMAASALRVAQAIGLHRNLGEGFGLTAAEVEQRRNVFWIAVVIERSIVYRSGRPSVIHEDDIGIGLPKELPITSSLLTEHLPFGNLRVMTTLALLQGRVYNKLYSAKSLTKSKLERLKWVGFLDEELQSWKDSLPIEIRPGHEVKCHERHVIPVLMMHFGYFNTVSTIHRGSLHYGAPKQEDFPAPDGESRLDLNPRVFASGAIRLSAARSIIKLLELCQTSTIIHSIEINVIRMVDYYPLTASLTLFANILQNPLDPQALEDITLMKSVTTFLSNFFDDKDSLESSIVIKTFLEVNQLATQHVEKMRKQGSQPPKRSRPMSFLPAARAVKAGGREEGTGYSAAMRSVSGSTTNEDTPVTNSIASTPSHDNYIDTPTPIATNYPAETPPSSTYHYPTHLTTLTNPVTPPQPQPQSLPEPQSHSQSYSQSQPHSHTRHIHFQEPLPPQIGLYDNAVYSTTNTNTHSNTHTNSNINTDNYYTADMLGSINSMMPQDGSWFTPVQDPYVELGDWDGLDWDDTGEGWFGADGGGGR